MWDKISAEQITFLLVDFQDKFFPIMPQAIVDNARANVLLMIRMFKELEVPMVGTDHYRKGLGLTDPDVLREWNGAPITDKKTFSCLGDDACLRNIEATARRVVVLAGLETHICVLQTALDLRKSGYDVIVVKDACLSSNKLKWENGLDLMKDSGVLVLSAETLLFYLVKRIDVPCFKTLVRLLKEKAATSKSQ